MKNYSFPPILIGLISAFLTASTWSWAGEIKLIKPDTSQLCEWDLIGGENFLASMPREIRGFTLELQPYRHPQESYTHRHPIEEVVLVIKGRVNVEVDGLPIQWNGQPTTLGPGDLVSIPAKAIHRLLPADNDPVEILHVFKDFKRPGENSFEESLRPIPRRDVYEIIPVTEPFSPTSIVWHDQLSWRTLPESTVLRADYSDPSRSNSTQFEIERLQIPLGETHSSQVETDQAFFAVLSGRGHVRLGGLPFSVEPGTRFKATRGTSVSFISNSNDPLDVVTFR